MCWLSYTLTILYKVLMDYILPQDYQSLNNFLFILQKRAGAIRPGLFYPLSAIKECRKL